PPAVFYPLSLHDALPIYPRGREHEPEIGGRAAEVVEDGEDERDRRHCRAEQARRAGEEEDAEVALGERAEPAHAARSRMRSATRSEEHTSELQSRFDLVC